MRHIPWIAALALGAFPLTAHVQQPSQENPYSKLAFFEGKWTIEGQESTYLEVCEWFQNRRHLICKAEDKEGGTSTWGMSIFGYSRETNAYTHTLFGSGPVRTIHGWLDGATWTFTGEHQAGMDAKRTQIAIKPTKKGFTFRQDVSTNGSAWKRAAEFTYVRLP